jgi:hypothetical protein
MVTRAVDQQNYEIFNQDTWELDPVPEPEIDEEFQAQDLPVLPTRVVARQESLKPSIVWEVRGLENAYEEKPPREYIVDGLFSLPSVSIIYGIPGSMKSLIMMDLAACVAGGKKWLQKPDGAEGMQVKQCPVIWCDFDMGVYDTEERMAAIGKAYDLPTDTPIYYVAMPEPWLDATNYESKSFIQLRLLAAETGAKFIVVDNLSVISGAADENSAEMKNVLSSFRRLAEMGNISVVLIHHPRKAKGYTGNTGDSLRGHSSILAALNVALEIRREPYAETISLVPQKSRGSDIAPFGAVFSYEHKSGNNDLKKARFFAYDLPDVTSNFAIGEAILAVLTDAPGTNKTNLVNTVKDLLPDVGINRIRDQITYLVQNRQIGEQDGTGTSKLYFPVDL